MAHARDRTRDGTGAIFAVRNTPWHREGTVLESAPSLHEALRLGCLGFEVEVRPLFTRVEQSVAHFRFRGARLSIAPSTVPAHASSGAQDHGRVGPGGAPRGEVRGEQEQEEKGDRKRAEYRRLEGLDSVEESGE